MKLGRCKCGQDIFEIHNHGMSMVAAIGGEEGLTTHQTLHIYACPCGRALAMDEKGKLGNMEAVDEKTGKMEDVTIR